MKSHWKYQPHFYPRKAFENIMCKTTAILSQHKCVRLCKSLCEHPFLTINKINIDMSYPSMKMLSNSLIQFSFSPGFIPGCAMNNNSKWVKIIAWRRSHNINTMMHICVDYLGDFRLDNVLSLDRRHAIISTSVGKLLTEYPRTNLSEIQIGILTSFS